MLTDNYEKIKDVIPHVFIAMPFKLLDEYMPLVKEYRFNLEVLLDHEALDRFKPRDFIDRAHELKDLGLRMTIHAPFNEMFPGAPDRLIREASVKRLDAAFELAKHFSPGSIVMHLNYEIKRFGFIHDEWLSNIIPNLKKYAEKCGEMGSLLSLENVYEENPDTLVEVLDSLKGLPVCHCLDVGHQHSFSETGLGDWLAKAGGYIGQFHLHDNDSSGDSHLPIGKGTIDFDYLSEFIAGMKRRPLITLEPHSREALWMTLEGFKEKGIFKALSSI